MEVRESVAKLMTLESLFELNNKALLSGDKKLCAEIKFTVLKKFVLSPYEKLRIALEEINAMKNLPDNVKQDLGEIRTCAVTIIDHLEPNRVELNSVSALRNPIEEIIVRLERSLELNKFLHRDELIAKQIEKNNKNKSPLTT